MMRGIKRRFREAAEFLLVLTGTSIASTDDDQQDKQHDKQGSGAKIAFI
ncbi:hypothetical protein QY96_00694 [Bacillus thermotolerans]|nr:hypothetical protein QY96_00694 [Bacillus thermotolerans]